MSALMLRLIACAAMLLDHIGYCLNSMPLRIIGRLAFPIYVYLIYNGYKHTSSRLRYALRLGVFALISQIPFSLFCYNDAFYPKGNVFVTLLMALLCVWAVDAMRRHRVLKWGCLLPAVLAFAVYHFGVLNSDYGAKAILMVMVFWLFDGKCVTRKVLLCAAMLCAIFYAPILSCAISLVRGNGFVFPVSQWDLTQAFSLFALPLIFAYNGEKGKLPGGRVAAKLAQYGFYAFYPLHMLILWVMRIL